MRAILRAVLSVASLVVLPALSLAAQENYEIQVYGAATVPRGVTMFELHSNYTTSGDAIISARG